MTVVLLITFTSQCSHNASVSATAPALEIVFGGVIEIACIPLTHEEHMELHRIGPRQFQEKCGIDFEVIIEGLFTERSEIQERRFGQNVFAVERKLVAAYTLDGA